MHALKRGKDIINLLAEDEQMFNDFKRQVEERVKENTERIRLHAEIVAKGNKTKSQVKDIIMRARRPALSMTELGLILNISRQRIEQIIGKHKFNR